MLKQAGKNLKILMRADMAYYLLPPLMILLVAGTVAQKSMGLYAAHKMFFSSFFFWAGPVPLPGGYSLIGMLALSLLVKFIGNSKWHWHRTGINLTHFGVLVLLFGGFLTAAMARESFMVLTEGAQTPYTSDYHQRMLYVFEDGAPILTLPFAKLDGGVDGLPFTLNILERCAHCTIAKRTEQGGYRAMAQFMALENAKPGTEPESDMPGVTFVVSNLSEAQNGTYIAFDGMPKPVTLQAGKKTYDILLAKRQYTLPFALRLVKFTRETWPGTDKAKSYASDIVILDNGVEWPARIAMNEPLRYKGYTFYQSSFAQDEMQQASILAVVENNGRLFPYIGTILMAAGLLLHVFITLRGQKP